MNSGSCCIVAIVALLLVGARGKNSFIVIVDAGSTGSRAHVFKYPSRIRYADHFPFIVPQNLSIPTELGSYSVKPGISSYSTNPEDLEAYITPIIQQAKEKVLKHTDILSDVPLYLGATAGMRMLDDSLRDKVMSALREYFMSSRCPFYVGHKGQVRVLTGEEEGTFGWLATNIASGTLSASSTTTHGALDLGGGSAQISFLPGETSILSNMFTMHMGNFSDGPIHLYTHSFLQYGYVTSFQNSARSLAETAYNSHSFVHPCLPAGVLWNTSVGQYGVSTAGGHIERKTGSTMIRGTGNFFQCRILANEMMYHNICPIQPCSILSVYQPRLGNSKFHAFGEYVGVLDLLNISLDPEMPVLELLQAKLISWCSMSVQQQSAVNGQDIGTAGAKLELSCWMGTWILELLTSGFGFPINTRSIIWGPDIGWTEGQALYEINFFPFVVEGRGRLANENSLLSNLTAVSDSSKLAATSSPVATQASMLSCVLTVASGLTIFTTGFMLGRADQRRAIGASEIRTHLIVK